MPDLSVAFEQRDGVKKNKVAQSPFALEVAKKLLSGMTHKKVLEFLEAQGYKTSPNTLAYFNSQYVVTLDDETKKLLLQEAKETKDRILSVAPQSRYAELSVEEGLISSLNTLDRRIQLLERLASSSLLDPQTENTLSRYVEARHKMRVALREERKTSELSLASKQARSDGRIEVGKIALKYLQGDPVKTDAFLKEIKELE